MHGSSEIQSQHLTNTETRLNLTKHQSEAIGFSQNAQEGDGSETAKTRADCETQDFHTVKQ